MSNFDERGAYSPRNDEPLAFDARYPRGGERRPAPTALILSVAVLLLLAAGVFFYYRSGIRAENEAPRVLGQPVGEMVSPPPTSSQPADPTSGLEIYRTEQASAAETEPTFAPAPEQPVARPEPPAASAARAAPAPAATALRPAQPATPVAAAAKPTPDNPAPATAKPSPSAAAPATTETTAKPAAAATAASVQIGAFSDAAQADKGWNDVARALPGDMAGRGKRVVKADVGGTTFHRTFVTGFASRTEAQAFCGKLKAAGKSCIVR